MIDAALESVTVAVADGTSLPLHIAHPAAPNHEPAAILVLQDAFGYNSYLRGLARRFSALGLTTVVPELYHRTGDAVGAEYDNPQSYEATREHRAAATQDGMLADILAAHAWIVGAGGFPAERVAAVGWCAGGRNAFLANAHLPLACAISFYGGGIAPKHLADAKTQHGRILMIWGGADTFLSADERNAVADALTAAGKAHDQLVFSDAQHGFFSPFAPHEFASNVAWSATVAYLQSSGVLVPR